MKYIDGGVCSAKGFRAGGMNCGIKAGSTKKDLAMILNFAFNGLMTDSKELFIR